MDQSDLFRLVSDALERAGVAHAFTGGHASAAYGENRFVNDIDVVVDPGRPAAVGEFLASFPVAEFQRVDAADGRVSLFHDDSSQRVDVIRPTDPAWPDGLARRRRLAMPDCKPASFAAPEDVILHKMGVYHRGGFDTHLRDAASILRITGDGVDRGYIDRRVEALGLAALWGQILAAVGGRTR